MCCCCIAQESATTDCNWGIYKNGSSPEPERARALAEAYSTFKFAVVGGVVAANLSHRSSAEVAQILEAMKAKFIALASARPIEFRFPSMLMVLRRK